MLDKYDLEFRFQYNLLYSICTFLNQFLNCNDLCFIEILIIANKLKHFDLWIMHVDNISMPLTFTYCTLLAL